MSITVNQDACIGCGACAAICPDTFQMNNDGKAEVASQNNVDCAHGAADTCPVQAITVA